MMPAVAPTPLDFATLRRDEFPVAERYVYLNHAALGPLPRRTADTVATAASDLRDQGIRAEPNWFPAVERTRRSTAALLGIAPDTLAFTSTTSQALSVVAASIPWKPRDVIVTIRGEYPANVYPWVELQRAGVEVRFVQPRQGRIVLSDVEQALNGARMLAISWVQYNTGFRSDLADLSELCQRRRVMLCLDAMQGVGVLPIDLAATPVDFCAFGGHKWLLAPQGVGVLYVNPRVHDRLLPAYVGGQDTSWHDYAAFDQANPLANGTARHEDVARALLGVVGLERSLQLFQELGTDTIAAHIHTLTEHLAQRMLQRGYQMITPLVSEARSGILAVSHPQYSAHEMWERLRTARIVAAVREGGIRLSPHVYNTIDEMDAVVEALEGIRP